MEWGFELRSTLKIMKVIKFGPPGCKEKAVFTMLHLQMD